MIIGLPVILKSTKIFIAVLLLTILIASVTADDVVPPPSTNICLGCHQSPPPEDTTPPHIIIPPVDILEPASSVICSDCHTQSTNPDPKVQLGRDIFTDATLSTPTGLSCAKCHDQETGYTGPDSAINEQGAVYQGAAVGLFGNRKPPSVAYTGDSPILHCEEGTCEGGMFWDGRATGISDSCTVCHAPTGDITFGDPLAQQALGPFLNPLEQANPSPKVVCLKVRQAPYAPLFGQVWDSSLDCEESPQQVYEQIGESVAAYERSPLVSSFTSRYDDSLKGDATLSADELSGLALFEGKAGCSACHVSQPSPEGDPPLFTDYSYDNLGIPRNLDNPFYTEPAWNPLGTNWVDNGLGGFLESVVDDSHSVDQQMGKVKVPTLRNVDKRPDEDFVKAYGHNGYFKSLEAIVHFYNTRDVLPPCSPGDESPQPGVTCWPAPEVADTINTVEMGNLGLTQNEEAKIVLFLKTLTDENTGTTVPNPDLTLEKAAGKKYYANGEKITYTFAVTNSGNVPLQNIQVTDDMCGGHATFRAGDTNGNGFLDIEEKWTFDCSYVPVWKPNSALTNTARATGLYMTYTTYSDDTFSLYPFTLTKNVQDYAGTDITWAGSFQIKMYRYNSVTNSYSYQTTYTLSESSPLKLWLSEGQYKFEETGLPQGFQPVTPIEVTIPGTTYPDTKTFTNTVWYGCSPGYWKNHGNSWPTGYSTKSLVSGSFSNAAPYGTRTLLQALNLQGGSTLNGAKEILIRAGTAGQLNEAAFGEDYPAYPDVGKLKSAVSAALAKDRTTILNLATSLDKWNNGYCPKS